MMLVALAQQTFGERRNTIAGRIYFLERQEWGVAIPTDGETMAACLTLLHHRLDPHAFSW